MNKKRNSFFFIVAAALFNLVTTLLIFMILFILFFAFIRPFISDAYVIVGIPFVFIISIFLSFTVYKTIMKHFLKAINIDEYFDPLSIVDRRIFIAQSNEKNLNNFISDSLCKNIKLTLRIGSANPSITGLEYDSRAVREGSLYFALPGIHVDGHAYIGEALKKGAKVIVLEKEQHEYEPDVVYLLVKDSRFAMSAISAAFYDYPSKHITCIGVTGTEGKSTTVYLIFQLLRSMGLKVGFISTVQYSVDGTERWNPEHQTTPEATVIHKRLAEMLGNGCEYAVIESSSHALSEKTNRLGDVFFDAAVMTNVTHEHLEFHGTWEQYRFDKANLFRALNNTVRKTNLLGAVPIVAVVNADDKSAAYFADCVKTKTWTHSVAGITADLSIQNITSGAGGNEYDMLIAGTGKTIHINDKLPGAFNAGNVMATLLIVSNLLSRPIENLISYIPSLKPVRGRMTHIDKGQPFEVIVDYAHTPSSFETIFPPLRERLTKSGGRIISLFGSAGERDTKKRSEQGRIAARYSDIIILSDEDPRGEKPMDILEEIAGGIAGKRRGENLFLIPDRRAAIKKAFSVALPGDLVLLLGKGHENSIIYSTETIKWDEIAEAESALNSMPR